MIWLCFNTGSGLISVGVMRIYRDVDELLTSNYFNSETLDFQNKGLSVLIV